MNIMNELELYKHTNSVQAKEIEQLKGLNRKYRVALLKISLDGWKFIETIVGEKD